MQKYNLIRFEHPEIVERVAVDVGSVDVQVRHVSAFHWRFFYGKFYRRFPPHYQALLLSMG